METIYIEDAIIGDIVVRYLKICSYVMDGDRKINEGMSKVNDAMRTGDTKPYHDYLCDIMAKKDTDDKIEHMCDIAQFIYDTTNENVSSENFITIVTKLSNINCIVRPNNATRYTDWIEDFKKSEDIYENRKDLMEKIIYK